MARWRPKHGDNQQNSGLGDSPLEHLRKRLFKFLNSRLGWPAGAALVAMGFGFVGWDTISKHPLVHWAVTKGREMLPVPKAQGDGFALVIPRLENDIDGLHRRLISDALRSQFSKDEIEVLLIDRSIPIEESEHPQEAVRRGYVLARDLLRDMKANVMLWGEALDVKPDAPLRLHWTLNSDQQPHKTSDKYRLSKGNFDLPELFRQDLNAVLSLLVSNEIATFNSESGHYAANRLQIFITRVEQLVGSGMLSSEKEATLEIALADALDTYGDQRGSRPALEQSMTAYQRALSESMRVRAPLDWAATQNSLGNALATLGERDSSAVRLMQAVSAYQEALKEYTRERVPLDWAGTQSNLGNALDTLGKRESGTERLLQAVSACQEALKEDTRERVPLVWAMAQNNLGNALAALGQRERDTNRLLQALSAYREALKEYTRERVPLDWAGTQNNLGIALTLLGAREGGTERLVEAVSAYRESLKERTPDRVPLDWAATQSNLGSALAELGERESGTERLAQAVSAYQEALKARTRDRVPMDWAATQNNLGIALEAWGEREAGTERLAEAVSAYQEALKEYTNQQSPYYHDVAAKGLEHAMQVLRKRKDHSGG
jgi:tetratricopeptide (TPR) repeat protein